MKTTKTLTAAILVLLSAVTFAQDDRGLFLTVKYSEEMNRLESWVSNLQDRFNRNSEEELGLPVISETYYFPYAEIAYEDGSYTEDWMINPFEDMYYENEIQMEPWMTTPFEEEEDLEILALEEWMSAPFDCQENEEELYVEEWMTVPFKCRGKEEELCLEDWMAVPFETDSRIGSESMLTAAFQD